MQSVSGNDHGAAKRVTDENHWLIAAMLQVGDPGHDIERTFGQDVGVTVAHPQGGYPVPTQPFREPGIGALAWPAESTPCTTHPDHPSLRLRGLMHDRLDVTPVSTEQQPLPQFAFVGWAGEHVVDADGEGVRVFLARLVVQWLWHFTHPPGEGLWGHATPGAPHVRKTQEVVVECDQQGSCASNPVCVAMRRKSAMVSSGKANPSRRNVASLLSSISPG